MEPLFGDKELSLKERLYANAKSYSFEMAAYILETNAAVSFGKETRLADAPFRTISINSFHLRATEIEKLSIVNDMPTVHIERLSLAGINAPLPTPYAELIFRRSAAKDFAISSFINMFNARLLGIGYQISKKNHLCLQRHRDAKANMLVKTIDAFSGNDAKISGPSFSRLSYLFWTKIKSAAGLEAILRSIFPFEITVHQFKMRWIKRQKIVPMHSGKLRLGVNSELGTKIFMADFDLEIILRSENYQNVINFVTSKRHNKDFRLMVEKYLGDFFKYTVRIIPKTVPPLQLGQKNPSAARLIKNHSEFNQSTKCVLGKTSWIPMVSINNFRNGLEFDPATIMA